MKDTVLHTVHVLGVAPVHIEQASWHETHLPNPLSA